MESKCYSGALSAQGGAENRPAHPADVMSLQGGVQAEVPRASPGSGGTESRPCFQLRELLPSLAAEAAAAAVGMSSHGRRRMHAAVYDEHGGFLHPGEG